MAEYSCTPLVYQWHNIQTVTFECDSVITKTVPLCAMDYNTCEHDLRVCLKDNSTNSISCTCTNANMGTDHVSSCYLLGSCDPNQQPKLKITITPSTITMILHNDQSTCTRSMQLDHGNGMSGVPVITESCTCVKCVVLAMVLEPYYTMEDSLCYSRFINVSRFFDQISERLLTCDCGLQMVKTDVECYRKSYII